MSERAKKILAVLLVLFMLGQTAAYGMVAL